MLNFKTFIMLGPIIDNNSNNMMMSKRQHQKNMIKKENIINLTDIGNHNPVRARRLPYGKRLPEGAIMDESGDEDIISYPTPGVGTRPSTKQQPKGLMRSASEPSNSDNNNNFDFVFATTENDNKEMKYLDGPLPENPEPHNLEHLEATGATIIKSVMHFPKSNQTITTRSMTPEEHAAERERQQYLDR